MLLFVFWIYYFKYVNLNFKHNKIILKLLQQILIIKKKNDINIIGDAMVKKILLLTSLFVFGICSLTLAEEIKVSKKENIDKSKD